MMKHQVRVRSYLSTHDCLESLVSSKEELVESTSYTDQSVNIDRVVAKKSTTQLSITEPTMTSILNPEISASLIRLIFNLIVVSFPVI